MIYLCVTRSKPLHGSSAYGVPYGEHSRPAPYGGLRRTLRTLTVLPARARFKQVLCLRRLTAHLTDPYGFPNGNAFSTMVLLTAAYGLPYGPLRFSQWECDFNIGSLRLTLRTDRQYLSLVCFLLCSFVFFVFSSSVCSSSFFLLLSVIYHILSYMICVSFFLFAFLSFFRHCSLGSFPWRCLPLFP